MPGGWWPGIVLCSIMSLGNVPEAVCWAAVPECFVAESTSLELAIQAANGVSRKPPPLKY